MNTLAPTYILALDLGTAGNRAILFDQEGTIVSSAYFCATKLAWLLEHIQKQAPATNLDNVLAGRLLAGCSRT